MFIASQIHGERSISRSKEKGTWKGLAERTKRERNNKVRKIQAEGPPEVAVTATAELV